MGEESGLVQPILARVNMRTFQAVNMITHAIYAPPVTAFRTPIFADTGLHENGNLYAVSAGAVSGRNRCVPAMLGVRLTCLENDFAACLRTALHVSTHKSRT